MHPISIVILTKNESIQIERCIHAVRNLSDDILILDNGSTDGTQQLASAMGARVIETNWKGYAATKNEGNQLAYHDWILSLDADEVINEELAQHIQQIFTQSLQPHQVFSIQRKLVIAETVLHYGSVANEYRMRLFNRTFTQWDQQEVHENLICPTNISIRKLRGFAWHYSYISTADQHEKLYKYAQLSAKQMYQKGKKASWFKIYLSPLFNFIKNYIFRKGFLDGKAGYSFAKQEMMYTRNKYKLLLAMHV